MFQTIEKDTIAEKTEKKSKFIAHAFSIESVEEAEKRLEEVRKKYHDARHNCYAYRVLEKEQTIQKSSDDGEPSGTAGAPMLTILEKNELNNVLVVVTRYFGGILLGTGGLVRAYSEATNSAIRQTEWIQKELGYEIEVKIPYSDLDRIRYFCKQNQISIQKEEYLDNITLQLECDRKQIEFFQQKERDFDEELIEMKILRKKYVKKSVEK